MTLRSIVTFTVPSGEASCASSFLGAASFSVGLAAVSAFASTFAFEIGRASCRERVS